MLTSGNWQPCGSPENWFFIFDVNGRIFNGGRADTLYGQYMPLVNEWVDGAWEHLPNSPFNNTGTIYDVTYWHGAYYFVGSFLAGGARSAIRFDGVDQWTALEQGIGGTFTSAVEGYGDSLYAGGYLLPGPNVQSRHIQIWDGAQWLPFFDEVNVPGKVDDINTYQGKLYIAGSFTFGTDTTKYGLIRYDGHQICALGGYMWQGGNKFTFFNDDLYMSLAPDVTTEYVGFLDLATVVPDTCVAVTPNSIRKPGSADLLNAYPNPVKDMLSVRLPATSEDRRWQLVDASNRVVLSGTCPEAGTLEISTVDLAPGSYILVVSSPARSSYARIARL